MSSTSGASGNYQRLKREQEFHDHLASEGFESRSFINRITSTFYDKGDDSILWGPVWSGLELKGKSVLDYGCGDGVFSFMLADRGARVTGIDISPGVIEVAKQGRPGYPAPPTFVVGDAQNTGFPSESFDLVLGTGILHHLDLELAYLEIARILRPEGLALFMEPQSGSLFLRAFRKMTPRARSADERPLNENDLALASKYFSTVRTHEYFLLSVAAAPLHLASNRLARHVAKTLDRLDQAFFAMSPAARRSAWYTRLEMTR